MWKTIKQNFIKTFFPKFCLNCQKEGCIICYDCFSLIDINEFQFCPFCQKPNRVIGKGKCKKHRNFSLDGIFTAVDYKNQLVKKMITSLKYKPFLKELAEPLSNLMITHLIISKNQIIPQAKNIMAIIPVPLYIKKEKQRNQYDD